MRGLDRKAPKGKDVESAKAFALGKVKLAIE